MELIGQIAIGVAAGLALEVILGPMVKNSGDRLKASTSSIHLVRFPRGVDRAAFRRSWKTLYQGVVFGEAQKSDHVVQKEHVEAWIREREATTEAAEIYLVSRGSLGRPWWKRICPRWSVGLLHAGFVERTGVCVISALATAPGLHSDRRRQQVQDRLWRELRSDVEGKCRDATFLLEIPILGSNKEYVDDLTRFCRRHRAKRLDSHDYVILASGDDIDLIPGQLWLLSEDSLDRNRLREMVYLMNVWGFPFMADGRDFNRVVSRIQALSHAQAGTLRNDPSS